MLVVIQDVLTPAELARIRAELTPERFLDGKLTAGGRAAMVKKNLQTDVKADASKALQDLVLKALMRNSTFVAVTAPKRILPIRFNLYKEGMYYGDHVDNAIMGGGPGEPDAVRVDLSFTLFVSPPESYSGGELVIRTGYGEHTFKLPAGQMVVYPTYFFHHVAPVTKGERLAVVSWMQSMLRDPLRREMMVDLAVLAQSLQVKGKNVPVADLDLVDKVRKNLLRMWAEN